MTSRRIIQQAAEQIRRIQDHIARHDAAAAARVAARIDEVIEALRVHPRSGRRTVVRGLRMFVITPFPYLVLYRFNERKDEIVIVSVRHGARRRPRLQEDRQPFRS